MMYNGKKIKHGVNNYGIEYLKQGKTYHCTLRYGGMDVVKTFTGIRVEKIKPTDMMEVV